MNFKNWIIQESTINDLYNSTVQAFPNTTKRQHATDTINIKEIKYVPYIGVKTLMVKARSLGENSEYQPLILFKKIKYTEDGNINLYYNDKKILLESPSIEDNDVVLRCNCPDFRWRFAYYNHLDKSLYGRKPPKYKAKYRPGSANPMESAGLCKHLIKLIEVLKNSNIIK